MAVEPDEDEHISRQVVYEHTTTSRQSIGAIIAIVVLALALVVFIVVQVRQRPPHRRGELHSHPAMLVAAADERVASRG